jgi:hypothetical protein
MGDGGFHAAGWYSPFCVPLSRRHGQADLPGFGAREILLLLRIGLLLREWDLL